MTHTSAPPLPLASSPPELPLSVPLPVPPSWLCPVPRPPGLCPHELGCPSLDGWNAVSLKRNYLSQERELASARQIVCEQGGELRRALERCRALEAEKADLEAKIRALHRRQFKANRKKEEAGGGQSAEAGGADAAGQSPPGAKKRGAPMGHPGWFRKEPAEFDRTVEVPAPCACPYCHSEHLEECQDVREHTQEDIVLVAQTLRTLFRHHEAYCPRCGKKVIAWAEGQEGGAPIGPVAKALAIYLRHDIGISVRKAQSLLQDLFGLSCVPASLFGFDRLGAAKAAPLYEDLAEKIRSSLLAHADETHWREDGVNHYVWFAGNEDLAYFRIAPHRSGEAAQALLGTDFPAMLVTDGYAAYNAVGADLHQSCLAHLIRHSRDLIEEITRLSGEKRQPAAREFCEQTGLLFKEACQTGGELRAGKRDWELEGPELAKRFEARLDQICEGGPLSYDRAETFRNRLLGKERPQWFAFLRHPQTPPTNNLAERALRPIVLRRKVSFGTRSQEGSENLGVLTSILRTARLQLRRPLEFLQTLLTQDTPAASKALYHNNSS